MANRNILLIEPGYKNKYPPLGLMKIAQYHGLHGKGDNVRFIKGEDKSALGLAWDRIYVTTLFSFEYPKISESIDFAIRVANGQTDKIFVGGIAASLMHDRFTQNDAWRGIRFIKGLLGEPPAVALQLDDFAEEMYSDDRDSTPIEDLTPDYGILGQIDYKYPVHDAYFAYASRGCIRKCHFCGVPKLEGAQRDMQSLTSVVTRIRELYGEKKDLILMDNNVVASERFREIVAEIRDLGFVPGAMLKRGRVPVQRRVDFNQGVDARILCKDPMYLRELSSIAIKPLRIAFDHLGLKGPYEKAVRTAHEFGLNELSNYMLYNFHDDPSDLYERMDINVRLNEELDIRIWSFPMRYQPTDRPDRGHIGEKWSRYELRSMQLILQATHGVVSGAPMFFRRAFGKDASAFRDLLLRPHHFIFNRDWYDSGQGMSQLEEFTDQFNRLSADDRVELVTLLSSCDPRDIRKLGAFAQSGSVRDILPFYVPLAKGEEAEIWKARKGISQSADIPEDEKVEDAGLDDPVLFPVSQQKSQRSEVSL